MKAIVAEREGGPEVLSFGTVDRPEPGPEELLIKVHATALNRADLLQREGKYPPPAGASPILGLEAAGVIEEVGPACAPWTPGDRVCGLLAGGGYARYALVHRDLAIPLLPAMSFEEAAAIPEVFLTAFQALHWYGEIEAHKHVLIHAGASGVGTAAIQLAKSAGASVYVTASAGKHEACRSLGAELAIDYRAEDFAARILEVTDGRGADIIVDFVGAPYFQKNLDVLAIDGRIVMLATLGGATLDRVNLRDFFRKRATIFASTLRNRSLQYKIRLTQDFVGHAMPLFEDGSLRPVVDRVFDWSQVADAHRYMGENRNVGKIVLKVSD